jgi:hypothetical protein|mmetsp:Transcript_60569/g.100154  ORF Transcript_60569/g.100154 Transcript_60569/m.100154 type:complete len:125 (-) Transcript_60569:244-618(-)
MARQWSTPECDGELLGQGLGLASGSAIIFKVVYKGKHNSEPPISHPINTEKNQPYVLSSEPRSALTAVVVFFASVPCQLPTDPVWPLPSGGLFYGAAILDHQPPGLPPMGLPPAWMLFLQCAMP